MYVHLSAVAHNDLQVLPAQRGKRVLIVLHGSLVGNTHRRNDRRAAGKQQPQQRIHSGALPEHRRSGGVAGNGHSLSNGALGGPGGHADHLGGLPSGHDRRRVINRVNARSLMQSAHSA